MGKQDGNLGLLVEIGWFNIAVKLKCVLVFFELTLRCMEFGGASCSVGNRSWRPELDDLSPRAKNNGLDLPVPA